MTDKRTQTRPSGLRCLPSELIFIFRIDCSYSAYSSYFLKFSCLYLRKVYIIVMGVLQVIAREVKIEVDVMPIGGVTQDGGNIEHCGGQNSPWKDESIEGGGRKAHQREENVKITGNLHG